MSVSFYGIADNPAMIHLMLQQYWLILICVSLGITFQSFVERFTMQSFTEARATQKVCRKSHNVMLADWLAMKPSAHGLAM